MVELAGDRATARTYGNLVHVQELLDGKPRYVVQHAIYHDALERLSFGLAHHEPAPRQPVRAGALPRSRPREDLREAAALLSSPFRHRGIVEGFYGRPWAHADRLWWIDRLAELGMNTYVVAPKDDPLQRERWREPYPAEELARFGELVRRGRDAGVALGFALSPGLSIRYSDAADVATLVAKLRALRGARLALPRALRRRRADASSRTPRTARRSPRSPPRTSRSRTRCSDALGPGRHALARAHRLCRQRGLGLLRGARRRARPGDRGGAGPGAPPCRPPCARTRRARAAALLRRKRPALGQRAGLATGRCARCSTSSLPGREPGLADSLSGVLLNPMQHARASYVDGGGRRRVPRRPRALRRRGRLARRRAHARRRRRGRLRDLRRRAPLLSAHPRRPRPRPRIRLARVTKGTFLFRHEPAARAASTPASPPATRCAAASTTAACSPSSSPGSPGTSAKSRRIARRARPARSARRRRRLAREVPRLDPLRGPPHARTRRPRPRATARAACSTRSSRASSPAARTSRADPALFRDRCLADEIVDFAAECGARRGRARGLSRQARAAAPRERCHAACACAASRPTPTSAITQPAAPPTKGRLLSSTTTTRPTQQRHAELARALALRPHQRAADQRGHHDRAEVERDAPGREPDQRRRNADHRERQQHERDRRRAPATRSRARARRRSRGPWRAGRRTSAGASACSSMPIRKEAAKPIASQV